MIPKSQHEPGAGQGPDPSRAAAEAWKREDYAAAIEILARASQRAPSDLPLLLDLGEAYGLRYQYAEAERCLERAVAGGPNPVDLLTEAGRRCQRFHRPDMANRFLRRAAEHPGAGPWVWVVLAEFEEGHSRRDTALAHVERALQSWPEYRPAHLVRARLHRAAGELEAGERLLRSLVAGPPDRTTVSAWYELGTNLDCQGAYDDAMAAILQAKIHVRPTTTRHIAELDQLRAELNSLERSVSATTLERWAASGVDLPPVRPWALLCGHPRSGTTLIEQVLDAHPGIMATDESSILIGEAYATLRRAASEQASIPEILESASFGTLLQARADYFRFAEAMCGQPLAKRLLIDKNPTLDVHLPTVVRLFPEAKVLVAIRDPRDVCISCFMLPLPPGRLSAPYLSLEQTAASYAWVMGLSLAFRSRLPCPQLEIRYEDVVNDLERASRKALAFLGLAWDPAILRFDAHASTKLLRSAIDEGAAKPIFKTSLGRWRHYQKYLEPCLDRLEPLLDAFGYS